MHVLNSLSCIDIMLKVFHYHHYHYLRRKFILDCAIGINNNNILRNSSSYM